MRDGPILTLAELEDFDRESSGKDRDKSERRFCCPECGPQYLDKNHRNLSLNTKTGAWHCHRCNAGGTLREHWQPRQDRARATLRRVFELHPDPPPTTAPPAAAPEPADTWRAIWDAGRTLAGTPGAVYLEGRGIPLNLAALAGVRYTPNCYGRPAVLCPIVDQAGQIVAFNGRHTDQRTDQKAHSGGPKSAGVFATPGALAAGLLVIVEAPIDALSLAACGVPAVALCGTTGPAWLPGVCVLGHVALAFDADDAGDSAADTLRPLLESLGATVERWRPTGGKDWNDGLSDGTLAWQLFELGVDPPSPQEKAPQNAPECPTRPDSPSGGIDDPLPSPEQETAPVEQIADTGEPCSWVGCPARVTQPWEPIPGMPGRVRTWCAYGHQQIRAADLTSPANQDTLTA